LRIFLYRGYRKRAEIKQRPDKTRLHGGLPGLDHADSSGLRSARLEALPALVVQFSEIRRVLVAFERRVFDGILQRQVVFEHRVPRAPEESDENKVYDALHAVTGRDVQRGVRRRHEEGGGGEAEPREEEDVLPLENWTKTRSETGGVYLASSYE
jgi:hypothetical protein